MAESIYDEITDFANYAFNKAHAVCYAIVAYQTAWFKCHYPGSTWPPSSPRCWTPRGRSRNTSPSAAPWASACCPRTSTSPAPTSPWPARTSRFGLAALKGVGRGFTNAVLAQRQAEGPFRSFPDFCQRMQGEDLNKRVVESLIRAGAFDAMGVFRSQLMAAYEPFLDSLARNRRKNLEGQFDLFSLDQDQPEPVELVLPNLPEYPPRSAWPWRRTSPASTSPATPWTPIGETIQAHGAVPIASVLEDAAQEAGLARFQDGQKVVLAGVVAAAKTKTTRNNTLMAYVTLEDDTGSLELMAFSRTLEESGSYLQVNVPILVEGKLSPPGRKAPQVLCDRVFPLNQVPQAPATPRTAIPGKLYLRFERSDDPLLTRVRNLFVLFPGQQTVVLYLADTQRRLGPSASSCPPCSKNSRTCWGRPTSLWFPNPPCPRERKSCYVPTCAQRALPPHRQRMALIIASIVAQFALYVVVLVQFTQYFVYFYWICVGVSLAVSLFISTRTFKMAYKIAWIIPILLVPLIGGVMYIILGGQPQAPPLPGRDPAGP